MNVGTLEISQNHDLKIKIQGKPVKLVANSHLSSYQKGHFKVVIPFSVAYFIFKLLKNTRSLIEKLTFS